MAEPLRYPLKKIEKSDDYLKILIVDYVPPGVNPNKDNLLQRTSTQALNSPEALAKNGSLKKPLYQILLPIPQGISDSNMVSWGDDSLNPISAYAAGATEDIMKGANPLTTGANAIDTLKKAVTSGNGQNAITSYLSAMAVNNFGANVSAEGLLARSSGQVLNPNMELLFKGVQLRSFNFSFNMAPRDEKESGAVKSIIRTFKKSMAAKTSTGAGSGLFISSPSIFQLEYRSGNEKHPFLHSFKPCALVSMGVNYTGSGAYSTYEDATPVHMVLTLSFQELNPIYFSDYEDSDIGVGY